jgi:hypothetical protein
MNGHSTQTPIRSGTGQELASAPRNSYLLKLSRNSNQRMELRILGCNCLVGYPAALLKQFRGMISSADAVQDLSSSISAVLGAKIEQQVTTRHIHI